MVLTKKNYLLNKINMFSTLIFFHSFGDDGSSVSYFCRNGNLYVFCLGYVSTCLTWIYIKELVYTFTSYICASTTIVQVIFLSI